MYTVTKVEWLRPPAPLVSIPLNTESKLLYFYTIMYTVTKTEWLRPSAPLVSIPLNTEPKLLHSYTIMYTVTKAEWAQAPCSSSIYTTEY